MVVLIILAVIVYATRPKPPVVAESPPRPVKTAAEVQKQIDIVKASKTIPPGEKGRILGFLNMSLEQAKAREEGRPVPQGGPNPPPDAKPADAKPDKTGPPS
jgi:hypothetical protein